MSNSANVQSLFNSMSGDFSPGAMAAFQIPDIGAAIQSALGIPADQVVAREVVLVTGLYDDSGSITAAGNDQPVRAGHNIVRKALIDSKQQDNILMHIRYLNGTLLCPYTPVVQAPELDANNYQAYGGTPLYDQTVVALAAVAAKTQEFISNGVPVRTVTLIVTDGADLHSRNATEATVKAIVDDMVSMENHIIQGMGIYDGSTDFWKVFTGWSENEIEKAKSDGTFSTLKARGGMGILPRWVLTPGNTESEIRRAFQLASQSAVRASQGAASFSKTALGGFGATNP